MPLSPTITNCGSVARLDPAAQLSLGARISFCSWRTTRILSLFVGAGGPPSASSASWYVVLWHYGGLNFSLLFGSNVCSSKGQTELQALEIPHCHLTNLTKSQQEQPVSDYGLSGPASALDFCCAGPRMCTPTTRTMAGALS